MEYEQDKTTTDLNRRLLNLQRAEIDNILPEYFGIDYPKFKALFDAYYEYMDSSGKPSGQIHDLYSSRDATQVPESLLKFLEDELLLGNATFGGFLNKREAIKFSNQLYRSKGTKYSIQQFFRGFFNDDPQVIYPKENIFHVGPAIDYNLDSVNSSGQQIKTAAGVLGSESQKFLTDNGQFQVMSILIKSAIPVQQWEDAYKLFVHPAGAHLAAQIVLELVNGNVIQSLRESGPGSKPVFTTSTETIANMNLLGNVDTTLIQRGDGTIGMIRADVEKDIERSLTTIMDSTATLTFRELITPNSFLMDDSETATAIRMDRDSPSGVILLPRFDEHRYRTLFDSSSNSADSAHYPTGP